MNLRKIGFPAFLCVVVLLASSCGATRRLGKDAFVVVTSPVLVLYGAGTDTFTTATEAEQGLQGGSTTQVLWAIPAFFWHTIKHVFYVGVYAIDIFLFPIYGVADLHPYGPDIQPLDIYTGTWFDTQPDGSAKSSGTDAESGEPSAASTTRQ